MITATTVRRLARWTLGTLDSFVSSSRLTDVLRCAFSVHPSETLVGIYLNSRDNYLIITDQRIRVMDDRAERSIRYSEITQLVDPDEEDEGLDLLLEPEELDDVVGFFLPVLGHTDNVGDVAVFHEFLLAVLEKLQVNPINLKSINTREDLITYLKYECEWQEYTEALAVYLETDLPPERFDSLKIDPELLQRPEFWRAVALILNVPIRTTTQDSFGP